MIKHGILEVQIRNILIFKAEHIVSELLAIFHRTEESRMSTDEEWHFFITKVGDTVGRFQC